MTRLKYLPLIFALLIAGTAQGAWWQWSKTSSNNATADPSINWSEGQSPSSINDSARAMMARAAEFRDDVSGLLITGGTATAYTLTTNQGLNSTPNDGQELAFSPHVTNGTAPTLAADGGNAYPIQSSPGVAIANAALFAGTPYAVKFSNANSSWILKNFYNLPFVISPSSITTAMLQDGAATYGKIQKPSTTSRLLGTPSVAQQSISLAANNGSGLIRLTVASTTGYATGNKKTVSAVVGTTEANGAWTITVVDATHIDLQGSTFTNAYVSGGTIGGFVEEVSLGTGLNMNGNVLSAPAFPVPSGFKNLSIKVASNTTVTVAADFVTTTDGTNFQTTPLSGTINLGTSGAANSLDAGTIATSTWYAIWAIAKSDGTTAGLASTSFTSPTMPTGYTYKARIGAVRTIAASATLYGTWQFGRKAQYVVGLAQTSVLPVMANSTGGAVGTVDGASPSLVAVSISNYFPSSATFVSIIVNARYKNNASTDVIMLAPSTAYSGTNNGPSGTNGNSIPWVGFGATGISATASFMLESTNVYWAASGTACALAAFGWEDNL